MFYVPSRYLARVGAVADKKGGDIDVCQRYCENPCYSYYHINRI
jgi:hypothetical protein